MGGAAARVAPTTAFEVFEFQATRIGCVAADTLSTARTGRVAAVFDGGFYIQFGPALVFLGGVDLASGPLNLATSAPGSTHWNSAGPRVGDPVLAGERSLIVKSRFRFEIGSAPVWRPEGRLSPLRPEDLSRGLAGFREAATGRIPIEGLGGSIARSRGAGETGRGFDVAEPSIGALRSWLIDAFRNQDATCPLEVARLIGLGPGLTPSGDDLLGGAMIAAHAIGESPVAGRLWDRIRPDLALTGVISRAHLRAAGDGFGHEAIHRLLTAMLTGQAVGYGRLIDEIDRIGHSSGWDALAGVVLVLEAWVVSRSSP
jgi:hypothetical protein